MSRSNPGKNIELAPDEQVVAVVPRYASGPGWSNAIVEVHIVGQSGGRYRCEYLQPDEQSDQMHLLFGVGAPMIDALIGTVSTTRSKRPASVPA